MTDFPTQSNQDLASNQHSWIVAGIIWFLLNHHPWCCENRNSKGLRDPCRHQNSKPGAASLSHYWHHFTLAWRTIVHSFSFVAFQGYWWTCWIIHAVTYFLLEKVDRCLLLPCFQSCSIRFSHHHQRMNICTIIQAETGSDEGVENSPSLCKPVPSNENTLEGICTDFLSMISSKRVNNFTSDFFW